MRNDFNQELIPALKQVLTELPGWLEVDFEESNDADYRVRAKVRGKRIQFLLEVKSGTWRPEVLDRIRNQSLSSNEPIVVATGWIPPKLAKSLREEKGLNYLDTAGNAYLDFPDLQVFRETNAPPLVGKKIKRPVGESFNASAVRVGLQLLLEPALLGTNLRNLAALAGVSAPSAKFALDAFKDDAYVVDAGKKGRRLVDREAYFRKWAESYNLRFRPRRLFGTYSTEVNKLHLDGCDACWGGELAADLLTNNLRADPNGNVEVVQACWDKHQEGPRNTAPVFVVFADLMNTRDPRCLDIAETIFDTMIREKLNAPAH
jgi:hypothetical protein